jgi:2-octaprenyl-6-methoxyphenol hydroxylase
MTLDASTDIIVAGGGLTGLPLALALRGGGSDSGLKVTVIGREGPVDRMAPHLDGRAFALSASSKNLLQLLGVWPLIAAEAQPMTGIDVSDTRLEAAVRPILLHMDNATAAHEPAAYIVEAHVLRLGLAKVFMEREDIELVHPVDVAGFKAEGGSVEVALADGRQLRSRLLVASDGRASALRKSAGIGTIDWPADQWGIVATIAHTEPHGGRATQHFLPSGPFAILPLTGNRVSLVWTERRGLAERVTRMSDAEFLAEVKKRLGDQLGELTGVEARNAYPLTMLVAREYVRERFCLLGDAAHGMHWIAGQGLNYGLRDVAALAEVVIDAARLGLDIGALSTLERYERWRRFDSFAFTAAMVAINSLFSNDNVLLRGIRDFGLSVAERLPFAKQLLVDEAAGLSGAVPKMLKGEAI